MKNDKKFYTHTDDKKYVPTPVYPNIHFTFNEIADHLASSPGETVYVWETRTLLRKKHKGTG